MMSYNGTMLTSSVCVAGGIAGCVGNPGEIMMVRMQADMAKPPEKRLNYKNSIDGLIRVRVADRKWLTIIETCTLDDS